MNFTFLLSLISGAAGGNFSGGVFKSLNLGLLGNSIVGAIGGYCGLRALETIIGIIHTNNNHIGRDGANTSSVVATLVSGAIGGAILVIVIGALRDRMNRH